MHLDDISNKIMNYEQNVNNAEQDLATSALVVMVRGATTNLKFPLAAFGTKGLSAQHLDSILWVAVEILEVDAGLKVLFITCDGAAQNRSIVAKTLSQGSHYIASLIDMMKTGNCTSSQTFLTY